MAPQLVGVIARRLEARDRLLARPDGRKILRQREIDDLGAGAAEPARRLGERAPGLGQRLVPIERLAQADARRDIAARRAVERDRQQGGARQRKIADAACHHADRIEQLGIRLDPERAEQAEARLEAIDPAIGRRAVTEPPVWVPVASGTIMSATAAAEPLDEPPGGKCRVMRVGGRPGMPIGELGGDGLAHNHGTGGAGQRHRRGIGRRPMTVVDRRAVAGRHIDAVDDVLDADRNAVQQPGFAAADRAAAPRPPRRRARDASRRAPSARAPRSAPGRPARSARR